MHGKVHFAETDCFRNLFRAENADVTVPIFPVITDKLSTLDEHTARTTRWVQDTSLIRLENFDNQLHNRGGREEFTAPLSFRLSKVS